MAEGAFVYDIGLHDGSDTAYYLHQGCRVLAVDANPALIERARSRFADQLESGRLILVEAGIAAAAGQADFFLSEVDIWSSLDREAAANKDSDVTAITVDCRPFRSLLEEFGTPDYAKIDIEGADHLCLVGLERTETPAYLSMEMTLSRADQDLLRLESLGYDAFKIVRQNDFSLMTPNNLRRRLLARRLRRGGDPLSVGLRVARGASRRLRAKHNGWTFSYGSSGRASWELRGEWIGVDEALDVARELHIAERRYDGYLQEEWFDVHASRVV